MTRPTDLAERMGESAETLAATDAERRDAARRDVEALIERAVETGLVSADDILRVCAIHTDRHLTAACAAAADDGWARQPVDAVIGAIDLYITYREARR